MDIAAVDSSGVCLYPHCIYALSRCIDTFEAYIYVSAWGFLSLLVQIAWAMRRPQVAGRVRVRNSSLFCMYVEERKYHNNRCSVWESSRTDKCQEMKFVILVFCSVLVFSVTQSCTQVPQFKEKTNIEKDSLRGNVSFVIAKHYTKNNSNDSYYPIEEIITKYNKYGNTIKKKEFFPIFTTDEEYSYNDIGNIIVWKKNVLGSMGNQIKTTVIKYRYDSNGYINIIEELEASSNALQTKTKINRDKLGYPTEIIKEDMALTVLLNSLSATDTNKVVRTTCYYYNNDYSTNKISVSDKDYQKITIYSYNDKGLICQMDNKEYTKKELSANNSFFMFYNDYNDLIHCTTIDSIRNSQYDLYFTYEYDDKNNWIRKNYYDNFHELKEYTTRVIEYFPEDKSTKVIDYSWELKQSPLEKKFFYERVREQKCKQYLNDDFVLEQFREKMKREYSQYKIIGEPQIIYKMDSIYSINFNAKRADDWGGYYPKENITVKITLCIDSDSFYFEPIKGNLY